MRWLRTPLLHFLIGGAALFWVMHRSTPPIAPVIVTAGDVSRLRLDYTRETGLEPSPADEAALVDKAIREELLFREALAHGLDQHDRSVRNWLVEQMRVLSDDPTGDPDHLYAQARALGLDRTDLVVRRILVQKMRLIAAHTGEQPPSDAVLEAFYAGHQDEYRPPGRVTFWHVFLASSVRGSATLSDAEAQLARLQRHAPSPAQAVRQGDSFSVPPHVVGQSPAQIEKLFGAELAAAVDRAEIHTWIGPVRSPYGLHLVWIEARESSAAPPFAAVRQRVLERWQDEQRTRRVATLLHDLERRYPLRVESAAWQQRKAI
jgi:peptidyl-prolyl cis-trans isomerase C